VIASESSAHSVITINKNLRPVRNFLDRNYFPYDAGHTLTFAQAVIRLSENSDEELPIILNEGEEYFEVVKKGAA